MKDLPILKYNDLREVMWLDHHNSLNGTVVDDASLEVMLRIEKTMSRLDVVGDDDKRILWIELKAPRKCDREEDADKNGNYWYQLATGRYQQMHYLLLSNRNWRFVDLRSHESGRGERKPDVWHGNVSKALKKLEHYVAALVDHICANPDEYNDYVAENLPYSKREGRIRRKDLNRICPSYRTFDNPEQVISIVKAVQNMPITTFDKMTLRTYMHVWRILYEAYCTKDRFSHDDAECFSGLSDAEVFEHNSKGREVEGLNLDSETDYLKWEKENSSYHCHDVAYARVHLQPIKKGDYSFDEELDVPDDKWYFSLGYSVYGYSQDVVNMLEALRDAGILAKFWRWASANYRQVLLVPGNHEYYQGCDIMGRGLQWQWMFRENVGYYQNQVVRIDDTDFILSTLWSHVPPVYEYFVSRGLNDFYQTRFNGKRMTVEDYNRLHTYQQKL